MSYLERFVKKHGEGEHDPRNQLLAELCEALDSHRCTGLKVNSVGVCCKSCKALKKVEEYLDDK